MLTYWDSSTKRLDPKFSFKIWRVRLVVAALCFMTIGCKTSERQRQKHSTTQDIAITENGRVSLFYLDESVRPSQVIRASCPGLSAQNLSGKTLRSACQRINSIELEAFRLELIRRYEQQEGVRISNIVRDDLEAVIDHLRTGPDSQPATAFSVDWRNLSAERLQGAYLFASFMYDVLPEPPLSRWQPSTPITNHNQALFSERIIDSSPRPFFKSYMFARDITESNSGLRLTIEGDACNLSIIKADFAIKVGDDGGRWEKGVKIPGLEKSVQPEIADFRQAYAVRLTFEPLAASSDCELVGSVVSKNSGVLDSPPPTNGRDAVWRRDALMRSVMGTREHRLKHYLWHAVRNTWNIAPNSAATQSLRAWATSVGWQPPRPIIYAVNDQGQQVVDIDATANSGAGEDFLYMHRRMIEHLRNALGNLPQYNSWPEIPGPGDREFPVIPENRRVKTAEGYEQIQRMDAAFKSAVNLRNMSLSQLGVTIEYYIHNDLHNRFSDLLTNMRPNSDDPIFLTSPSGRWLWDTNYDHLVDSYSSHVNPIFWRLHLWIEDRVRDWEAARRQRVVWNDPWEGPANFIDPAAGAQLTDRKPVLSREASLLLSRYSVMDWQSDRMKMAKNFQKETR